VQGRSDAGVGEPQPAIGSDQSVAGVQRPVDGAGGVQLDERLGALHGQVDGLGRFERAVGEHRRQVAPLDPLPDDVCQ
jgi:hypothetical protein